MGRRKEYYTKKELRELGVPEPTYRNWLYVARLGKKVKMTVEEYVIPSEVVERWKQNRRIQTAN